MRSSEFNFTPGRVLFWDLDFLTPSMTYEELTESDGLKEDLVQVEFSGGLIVDGGWYRDGLGGGSFRVMVVFPPDWSHPLYSANASTAAQLVDALTHAVEAAKQISAAHRVRVPPRWMDVPLDDPSVFPRSELRTVMVLR